MFKIYERIRALKVQVISSSCKIGDAQKNAVQEGE